MTQIEAGTGARQDVPKPKQGRLANALRVISGVALASAALGVVSWPDIEAAAETPDAQERLLSETLAASPVGVRAKVKCQPGLFAYENIDGKVSPFKHIFLDQRVCDDAESYIRSDNKNVPTTRQTFGIVALEHEGLHIKYHTKNEPATACRAFQYTVPFMQGLGMTSVEHSIATEKNYQIYVNLGRKFWSTQCSEGGKYDLDLAHFDGLPVWN